MLLKRSEEEGAPDDEVDVVEDEDEPGGPDIRCPKCGWRPRAQDRWMCAPTGCGHVWNTFDTGGICPNCGRQWLQTACLACHRWSPHPDWYAKGDD